MDYFTAKVFTLEGSTERRDMSKGQALNFINSFGDVCQKEMVNGTIILDYTNGLSANLKTQPKSILVGHAE